ncbi:hypothetical protein M758_12G036200 [Ceratodon purpureus]|nr:hypothetical protein M758_12G036200 [Ceratodon purpureus]
MIVHSTFERRVTFCASHFRAYDVDCVNTRILKIGCREIMLGGCILKSRPELGCLQRSMHQCEFGLLRIAALLILLSLAVHPASAQQQNLNANFYSCELAGRCQSYAFFRTKGNESTLTSIATLLNASATEIATANGIDVALTGRYFTGDESLLYIPLACDCYNGTLQAPISSKAVQTGDTMYIIARNNFEGLTNYQAIMAANPSADPYKLGIGYVLLIPLMCACPTIAQQAGGTRFLLSYPIWPNETLSFISSRFNISVQELQLANNLTDPVALNAFSALVIPLPALVPMPAARFVPGHSEGHSRSKSVGLIAGLCAIIGAAIVAGLLLVCIWKRVSYYKKLEQLSHLDTEGASRAFTYKELQRCTKNFSPSELLSSGAFGDVYRGMLPSGVLVAVKRIKEDKEQGEESFLAEATSLRQIRHRNLLQLRGWCHTRQGLFLVYDFMCNGSLDKWLYRDPKESEGALSWTIRHSILTGVASALAYLHEEWVKCVLHRDIKSSNVMLDADFNACLGDFGLARLIDHQKLQKTTLLAGTLGYMAPEMHYLGTATKESDVYAFGVVVLEVVCGRRPLDSKVLDPLDFVLLESVWRAHEAGCILRVADPTLILASTNSHDDLAMARSPGDDNLEEKIGNALHLGLLCCLPDPSERPSMRAVKQWFLALSEVGAMDLPPLPDKKPHFPYSICSVESSEGTTSFMRQESDVSSGR